MREIPEENHDPIVAGIALHPQPQIQRLRVKRLKLARLAQLHCSPVGLYIGRILIRRRWKALKQIISKNSCIRRNNLATSPVHKSYVVSAIKKYNSVRRGIEKLP